MKKLLKRLNGKLVPLFLSAYMTMGINIPAQAVDVKSNEIKTPVSVSTFDEYEVLQHIKGTDAIELTEAGYSYADIIAIQDGTIEAKMTEIIFERAKLPETTLLSMGYSEDKISKLKALSGNECLKELSEKGVLSTCTTANSFVYHEYSQKTGKTYFGISYTWEWDTCPIILQEDCIGVGWNHNFALDPDRESEFQVIYVNLWNSHSSIAERFTLTERIINTAECPFSAGPYYNGDQYYAKFGVGSIHLCAVGKINDVKAAFKYAHGTIAITPAISPGSNGVSFTFQHAFETFIPPEIINHDRPTEI